MYGKLMLQERGGIEHGLTGEDAAEAWNQSSEAGCERATADARVTEVDDASGRWTWSGVMMAVNKHIASVIAQTWWRNHEDLRAHRRMVAQT